MYCSGVPSRSSVFGHQYSYPRRLCSMSAYYPLDVLNTIPHSSGWSCFSFEDRPSPAPSVVCYNCFEVLSGPPFTSFVANSGVVFMVHWPSSLWLWPSMSMRLEMLIYLYSQGHQNSQACRVTLTQLWTPCPSYFLFVSTKSIPFLPFALLYNTVIQFNGTCHSFYHFL